MDKEQQELAKPYANEAAITFSRLYSVNVGSGTRDMGGTTLPGAKFMCYSGTTPTKTERLDGFCFELYSTVVRPKVWHAKDALPKTA